VKTGAAFDRRPVKISARTDTLVVVDDLPEATEVALADPERKSRPGSPTSGSPTSMVAR
jgi:hypothetical protein